MVRFEQNEWLSEDFARQLAVDPGYDNMDRDLILYGNWSKRAGARDAEDVDDDARSAASDKTFGLLSSFTISSDDFNTELVLSSQQLSHQLRSRFPLLREIDLSDTTVLSPLGSAAVMKDCVIRLSEPHPSDVEAALPSLEIGATETDSALYLAAQVPVPTGTMTTKSALQYQ